MKSKNNGLSLIAVIVIVVVLVAVVGVTVMLVSDVWNKTNDDEIEYSKAEISESFDKIVNDKFMSAYAMIQETQEDLSTEFNEEDMIAYLTATGDYLDETVYMTPDISYSDDPTVMDTLNSSLMIYPVYVIQASSVSEDVTRYGVGANKNDGDVFTLEVITETEVNDDGTEIQKSTGEYNLIYTDLEGNEDILSTVYLYRTNET